MHMGDGGEWVIARCVQSGIVLSSFIVVHGTTMAVKPTAREVNPDRRIKRGNSKAFDSEVLSHPSSGVSRSC